MNVRILLIISSEYYGRAVKYKFETQLGYQVIWYKSLNELKNTDHDYRKINLGVVDFSNGNEKDSLVLNHLKDNKIPLILLTEKITSEIQEKIWSLKVIDYILRDKNHSIDSLLDVTSRYFNNHNISVLIVDNSNQSKEHIAHLLEKHNYNVFKANSGNEALKVLDENYESIKLIITDYTLEDMNGLDFTEKVRSTYPMDKIAIIGVSSKGNHTLMVQFIKVGANDFITKPFISELLYCRVTQNIKIIEYFDRIKELAIIDQLTNLNNRHYLKETGTFLFDNAKRHKFPLVTAMIDIDNFKHVNDTYGHDAGDIVLKEISKYFRSFVRKTDIVVRYGGEEFLIIGNNLNTDLAFTFFDKLRSEISEKKINIGCSTISITISIGVCITEQESLEDLVICADKKLYKAKTSGKNKVCL